jgi:hypothetical protein
VRARAFAGPFAFSDPSSGGGGGGCAAAHLGVELNDVVPAEDGGAVEPRETVEEREHVVGRHVACVSERDEGERRGASSEGRGGGGGGETFAEEKV